MQVYVEYALIENFCMDLSLLYCAKAITKNPCKNLRLVLASALGAGFAVAFPLMRLTGVWAIVVKIAFGAVMCLIAGRFSKIRGYLKFTAVFTASTFVLGGGLIAIFSLLKVDYEQSGGIILSSVPIGIPFLAAVILCIICKKVVAKVLAKRVEGQFSCSIVKDGKSAECTAFYDSGNKVYLGGAPVCVVDKSIAEKLVDVQSIKTFVDIHTVAGKAKIAVFCADEVRIDDGKSVATRKNVLFGVSPRRIKKAIMHPNLAEVN